jgi:hypothetical protein
VYDCTKKPIPTDKASVARIKYLTYQEYLKEFEFIWDAFSKERVLKGSFDKFVQSDTYKKGTATVDKEFLQSLDRWRTYLATSISWNNKNLDEDEINFAVQQAIDRLIFLRIAEDRSIEPYGNLKHAIAQGDFYKNLFHLFEQANEKYNSGIFDFTKDKISKHLSVDNKVIKTIINELYYPESPYEFSVLSVEILGSAYEQFLGKQIKINTGHRAKIEEKPEVRKAGGVYYTPQYIVEYIVKNTVGKLIEGKIPKDISKIKIVDPSCGSGSFLLGAFQYLLDFHKNYYSNNGKPSKGKKDNPLTPEGNLTTAEKKRILLNNIFGVDIDVNAVEVTKLSLLLKCMEGETEASINTQTKLWNERVLPSLDDNIKSGNSLIDIDYFDGQLDFGEEKKLKPFSWEKAFPAIFKDDGFDIVIGNPPYVRQETLGNMKTYFQSHYKVYHGQADLYQYFIEKGIQLVKPDGLYGIIVANKWMKSNYGEPLRKWLKEKHRIIELIDFGDNPVFQGATTYPCVLIAGKIKKGMTLMEFAKKMNETAEKFRKVTAGADRFKNKIKSLIEVPERFQTKFFNVPDLGFSSLQEIVNQRSKILSQFGLNDSGWILADETETNLFNKLSSSGIPLGEYVNKKIYYGIKTGLNEAFVINGETKSKLIAEDKQSADVIKPFLAGRDIKRYQQPKSNRFLILFPKGFTNQKGNNPKNGWKWLTENYSAIANHLKPFEDDGKKRFDKGDFWWELRTCDYYDQFEKSKIVIPAIVKNGSYTYDSNYFYSNDKTSIIPIKDFYVLGLLNSYVIDYYLKSIASTKQNGYFEYKPMYISKLPIREIDLTDKKEKSFHDEIVKNVDLLLKLNVELPEIKLQTKKEQLQSKIEYCEQKINEAVYKLYDLTDEETKIIEGK